MKGSVLVIEDEREIADLIKLYLEKEGVAVFLAGDGETGLSLLENREPDLVILDLNLPGLDGFEVLQILRRERDIPVMIVSARHEDGDMIMGFGIGADDFVPKPFSPRVLAARVRAHLRRSRREGSGRDEHRIRFGSCELDRDLPVLVKEGRKVPLTPREMELLCYLADHLNAARSQQQIYDAVWEAEFGDLNTVSVHIQRLRQKIEDDPSCPAYIKTVYGFGYALSTGGEE